jgi:phosphatidate cytidylyltransferase
MLGQRVVTAVVMLAILLPALFAASHWPFALVTLVPIAAAGWEWGKLNQMAQAPALIIGLGLAAACAAALAAGWTERAPELVWWLAAIAWLVAGAVALRAGPSRWPQLPRTARWVIGLLALWVAWLALAHGRSIGINFVLSVFCLVWAADIAAYFGGRRFGRRKLALAISPGKTWEGVYSGVLAVLAVGALWAWADQRFAVDSKSLYTRLGQSLGLAGAAAALIVLAGMSVVGDLVESLVKRAAGAKDSSRLLPGHGGVLDRIDALLPVFPFALALLALGAR